MNGYLMTENDSQSFASKACSILDDAEDLQQFGTAARRSALRYTVDERVAVWNDVFDRVMTSSAQG